MASTRQDSYSSSQRLQFENARRLDGFNQPDTFWDERHKFAKRSTTLLGEWNLQDKVGKQHWPVMSRYYDPLTMDAVQLSRLLANDTQFTVPTFPWFLEYMMVENGVSQIHQTSADDNHKRGIFSSAVRESPITIVHVAQERLYFKGDTISAVSVDSITWVSILQHFDVLPNFLELVHSNQGGSFSYTTYGRNEILSEDSSDSFREEDVTPEAFHVGYRVGSWGRPGYAIYARRDFHTNQVLVVLMGTTGSQRLSRLEHLFDPSWGIDLFHIVFELQSLALDTVEETRWKLDHKTQALESETGITIVHMHDVQPLNPEELRFNKSLHVIAEFAMFVAGGSARVRSNIIIMSEHMTEYEDICSKVPGAQTKLYEFKNLRSMCAYKISLAQHQHDQIQELRARLQSQLDIVKALVVQRDTLLKIDIASASKRDNEFMQSIAVVTLIFLPGTFVATFFSM